VGIGHNAGYNNSSTNNLACFGNASAYLNSGSNVVALGNSALHDNSGGDVIGIGNNAGFDGTLGNTLSNSFIVPSIYIPQYTDYAAASTAITVAAGGVTGNFYFFYNITTNSIDAVLL
jgi:hypothetical protein